MTKKKSSTGKMVRRTPVDGGTSDDAARAIGTGIDIGIGIGLGMDRGSRGSRDDRREERGGGFDLGRGR
jgi:hypothetical protein